MFVGDSKVCVWPRLTLSLRRSNTFGRPGTFGKSTSTTTGEYRVDTADIRLYDLLGLIIERLSGENYKAFVTREILQPLGMTQSTLELSQAHGSGDIAAGYWRCGENASGTGHNLRVDSGMDQGKGLAASAGLWSTAEDMVSALCTTYSPADQVAPIPP